MRTTLTLGDDLAGLLKERARKRGIPFKTLLNQTLRAGLAEESRESAVEIPSVIPHSFGLLPGIGPDKLGQVADELEVEAHAESLHRESSKNDSPERQRAGSRA